MIGTISVDVKHEVGVSKSWPLSLSVNGEFIECARKDDFYVSRADACYTLLFEPSATHGIGLSVDLLSSLSNCNNARATPEESGLEITISLQSKTYYSKIVNLHRASRVLYCQMYY